MSYPARVQEKQAALYSDVQTVKQLLHMLPDGFCYQYEGIEEGLVKLTFEPNPSFRPPGRLGYVFQHIKGTMWIDNNQKRLAEIDGHLASEIKFGWGLLGHLDQGGAFSVRQRDLESGNWEVVLLDINITGKALLFKSIGFQEREVFSEFQTVPRQITIRQAADILRQDGTQ